MTTELVVYGLVSLAASVGLLVGARTYYPRLEVSEERLASIQFLTAVIASLLALTGVGLVLIGLAM